MKTLKIKLNNLRTNKAKHLNFQLDLVEEFTFIYLWDKKWQLEKRNFISDTKLYRRYRDLFPEIHSTILQDSMMTLDKVVKGYITACKKKHKLVKFPLKVAPSLYLRSQSFTFVLDETEGHHHDAWLRVFHTFLPIHLCNYHKKLLKNVTKFKDSKIKRDKDGQLWLLLTIEQTTGKPELKSALGVDLGIVRPIVCSDGHMIGNGKRICHTKKEYSKRRARQQSNAKQISDKQFRWTQDTNHKLSRELIDYALKTDTGVLVLEDLKGTHLSNRKYRKYSWAYKDLIEKIKYKAEEYSIQVVSVNPAYTSQTCNICGLKLESNRKSQGLYSCECGYKGNADVNAAINILNLSVKNGVHVNSPKSKALNSKPCALAKGCSQADHPKIYPALTGTDADCFYNDAKIPAFWEALEGKVKG